VLPDTQVYALRYPGVFDSQTAWIARNADVLDIRYAFHLGDIVNNNTDLEWERAASSMALLDDVVPYAMVPGNHDYGPSGDASTRETGLNRFFSYEDAARRAGFGGAYAPGELDNTYHLFTAGGHDWIAVALEWGPRDEVIAWADEVMQQHPERLGIFITHAYLNNNDRRYDHTDLEHPQDFNPHEYRTPGGVNDGEELWNKLVRRHRFVLTLNGHVLGDGTGYLASTTDRGNVVHQMLANYQMRELGGEGYLRLLELLPDGRTLVVRSYSPLLDQYLMGPDQQMTVVLDVD
jgi:3',5'-cyclic AMP phosphodiesterase CpdA